MSPEPIKVPHRISRKFVRNHPHWIFVYSSGAFGSNGFGQSGQCQHEPNCYPVPVCFRFCRSNSASWFSDLQFDTMLKSMIDEAIAKVPRDKGPIVVLPKIGHGFSDLRRYAPKTYEYLHAELAKIIYPNIEWDYYAII